MNKELKGSRHHETKSETPGILKSNRSFIFPKSISDAWVFV